MLRDVSDAVAIEEAAAQTVGATPLPVSVVSREGDVVASAA